MFSAAIALLVSTTCAAQSKANVTLEGNVYKSIQSRKASADTAQPTGQYYIDRKGNMWPVYKSGKGKLYALRTSEAGNVYKYYLRPSDDATIDHEGN